MSAKIPMTAAGKAKLHAEIKQIKHVDRPKNVRDIEEARAHGDLSENAEYSAAKDKQSHIAGRLATLEDWIARAEVIDVSKLSGDKVVFGATVTLLDEDTEKRVTYRIVGEVEADLKQRMISVTSPLARSLIGRKVDELVSVQAPGGVREYRICELLFVDDAAADGGTA